MMCNFGLVTFIFSTLAVAGLGGKTKVMGEKKLHRRLNRRQHTLLNYLIEEITMHIAIPPAHQWVELPLNGSADTIA